MTSPVPQAADARSATGDQSDERAPYLEQRNVSCQHRDWNKTGSCKASTA